jgi:hypothetical protein
MMQEVIADAAGERILAIEVPALGQGECFKIAKICLTGCSWHRDEYSSYFVQGILISMI